MVNFCLYALAWSAARQTCEFPGCGWRRRCPGLNWSPGLLTESPQTSGLRQTQESLSGHKGSFTVQVTVPSTYDYTTFILFFFFSFIRFDQVSLPQGLCSKEISELKTGRHRNMEERQTELVLQRDHPTQRRFRLTATEQGQASEADPSDHGAHGGRAMSGDQKWHQEGEAEGSCGLSLFRKKSGANSKCYQVVTFVSNAERGKGVWDRAEPLVQDFSKLIFKVTDIHE